MIRLPAGRCRHPPAFSPTGPGCTRGVGSPQCWGPWVPGLSPRRCLGSPAGIAGALLGVPAVPVCGWQAVAGGVLGAAAGGSCLVPTCHLCG